VRWYENPVRQQQQSEDDSDVLQIPGMKSSPGNNLRSVVSLFDGP
jgi:hypothetical protein